MDIHKSLWDDVGNSKPYPPDSGPLILDERVVIDYYHSCSQDTLRQVQAVKKDGRVIDRLNYIEKHIATDAAGSGIITTIRVSGVVVASMHKKVAYTVMADLIVTTNNSVLGINEVTCLIPQEVKIETAASGKEIVVKKPARVCTHRNSCTHGRALLEYNIFLLQ